MREKLLRKATVQRSVRLPLDLAERVERASDAGTIGPWNRLVLKLVRQHLDELDAQGAATDSP